MSITREQLELAAKAAAYSYPCWLDSGALEVRTAIEGREIWSPLTDHGQLLDLAMACGIHLEPRYGGIEYECAGLIQLKPVNFNDFPSLAEAVITAAAEQQLAKGK